jgi:hypothetical protein
MPYPFPLHGESTVESVSEFVAEVFEKSTAVSIYRGHTNSLWELSPKIERLLAGNTSTTDRIFRERRAFDEFKRVSQPHLTRIPSNDWEFLAVARHYGLPTRLLDWTENSLAALYFSVEDAFDGDAAVWSYQRTGAPLTIATESDPLAITDLHEFHPPHIATRLAVQSSVFTVHPLDFADREVQWLGPAHKFVVPASARVRVRRELQRLGMHRATLFPDLDGIAQYISRSLFGLPDEPRWF